MISAIVWTCILGMHGVLCAGSDIVSVKKGDSVTLYNDFKITNQVNVQWYFENTRIAEIDLSDGESCTDVQCNEGAKGFTDRLKLDHRTGSLTIMTLQITDSGEYTLEILNTGSVRLKIFRVKVYGAGSDIVSVMEGDSVTLTNDFKRTNQDKIRWYFKNTRIAEIDLFNGKTCTDVQCDEGAEGFRDRLKLDQQTGNLTIMNTKNTDSGEYTLEVIRPDGDSEKIFYVTLFSLTDNHENSEGQSETSDSGSGVSAGAVAGICVVAVLLVIGAAAVVINYRRRQFLEEI